MTPVEVVERYFECMRNGDLAVVDVFTEDARLVGLGTVVEGREAIRAFYGASIDASRPSPRLVGPLLVEGRRVAAEIEISLASGDVLHVVDLFVVEGDHIRSLTYFVADH
ncbi:MAG: nuclear transport factor 2 family protein [Acidimicrobiia bacterium]